MYCGSVGLCLKWLLNHLRGDEREMLRGGKMGEIYSILEEIMGTYEIKGEMDEMFSEVKNRKWEKKGGCSIWEEEWMAIIRKIACVHNRVGDWLIGFFGSNELSLLVWQGAWHRYRTVQPTGSRVLQWEGGAGKYGSERYEAGECWVCGGGGGCRQAGRGTNV